ncbi:MAG TPA: hypothetical protein VEY10_05120 [Flavisolibacter sp.]|jgi:hypothetical protein|nr:hypothetical protein [Flavisolibacter sp.]
MKTATAPAIVQLEEKDLKEFRPVNETLAMDFLFPQPSQNKKNFGTVDLWNCRNKRRRNGIKIR